MEENTYSEPRKFEATEREIVEPETVEQETVEQDFLQALLHAEGISYRQDLAEELAEDAFTVAADPSAKIYYPWNPQTPDAEAFFADAETLSIFEDWQPEEIAHRSGAFFGQIEQLWTVNLETALTKRFAARIPQNWLTTIVQQTQKAVADAHRTVSDTSLSLADQLVQCVRDIAPGLAEEDFYVLARPLAAQMRNGSVMTTVDAFVAQVPQVEWEQLSEVQRARLGLAIARYALNELQPASD